MALTNSQYDAIMREYNRKQAKDRYEQEQRIKEVYGAIGQMEDLEKEISSLAVSQAKKLLEQGTSPAQAALMTGFTDQSHFTNYFSMFTGVAPGVYRKIFLEKPDHSN